MFDLTITQMPDLEKVLKYLYHTTKPGGNVVFPQPTNWITQHIGEQVIDFVSFHKMMHQTLIAASRSLISHHHFCIMKCHEKMFAFVTKTTVSAGASLSR